MNNPVQKTPQQIQQEELNRLAAMRSRTPPRNVEVNRQPTAPIKDNGGRSAVFQSGYIENSVSRRLFG